MTHAPFTLLQISDCHLLDDPDGLYREQSPDQNILALLPALKRLKPDGVVITGDVAEQGGRAAYERFVSYLEGFCDQLAYIPGNHDDRTIMNEVFSAAGYHSGPVVNWGGWRLALLDSVVEDSPSGELGADDLACLQKLGETSEPTLVFVHHPPMAVGSAWIDRYPLTNGEAFMDCLDSAWVKAVSFGHVHQVFVENKKAIQYLSAPATSVNSQAGFDQFTVDPTGPKARWFKLWPEGRWATGVISAG